MNRGEGDGGRITIVVTTLPCGRCLGSHSTFLSNKSGRWPGTAGRHSYPLRLPYRYIQLLPGMSLLTQKWLRQNLQPYSHKERVYIDVDATLIRFSTLRPKSDVYSSVFSSIYYNFI
jgi:hypothetical protein